MTKRVLRWLRLAHVRWLRPSYSSAEDMMALARRWSAAGLSNVRATRLDFTMPFGSFEEFWIPFTSGATPLSAFSAAVNRATDGELETLYRKRLRNVRADGSFEFAARALAVSGVAAR